MTKYTKDQIITVSSAIVFLVGAVFMLVNVFGGHTWSFIVGLSLAVVASLLAGWAYFLNRKNVKSNLETTNSSSEAPS